MNEDSKYPDLDPEVLKVAKLDPEVTEASQAVRQALLEIHGYNSSNQSADALGKNIEALVAAGALSSQTVARLANYQTRFHGFSSRCGQDITVFDVVMTNRTPPLRVVGFADGHAQLVAVEA